MAILLKWRMFAGKGILHTIGKSQMASLTLQKFSGLSMVYNFFMVLDSQEVVSNFEHSSK
jgi:hypothetical protein